MGQKKEVETSIVKLRTAIEQWDCFRRVKMQKIDCEVGLLIGVNAPQLMEPWQIINSQHWGPYSAKTLLGWVVNGLNYEVTSEVQTASCAIVNPISVMELNELMVQPYNHDFPEKQCDEGNEMSGFWNHSRTLSIWAPIQTVKIWRYLIIGNLQSNSLKRNLQRNKVFHEGYSTFLEGVIKPTTSWGRFWHEPLSLIADVKGRFHQVKLPPSHRHYFICLWWPGDEVTQPLVE